MAVSITSIHTVALLILFGNVYSILNSTFEKTSHEENIFTDVMKNISRVNKVLQELIKSYHEMQKLYDSESFENQEIANDDVLEKSNNKYKKPRTFDDSTDTPDNVQFPATAMFFSEEYSNERQSDSNDETIKDNSDGRSSAQLTESWDESITNDEDSDISDQEVTNTNNATVQTTQQVFKDKTSTKKSLLPKKKKHPGLQPTTSYNNSIKETKTKKVKKIIYFESFPEEKIWDQIANKTPVKLRTQNVSEFARRNELKKNKVPKSALVILTRNKVHGKGKKATPGYLDHLFSSNSEERDVAMDKEIFKANILRQAYGEACMKMVIKKCYKACKEVNRIVCTIYKCRSDFKEKFIESSKTGCINEFNAAPESDSTNSANYNYTSPSEKKYRGGTKKFLDATRERFPAGACYPYLKPLAINETNKQNSKSDKRVLILRDKYERACLKASTQKCKNACEHAYTETCETYDCRKTRKRAYRRHCKKQCKLAYKNKNQDKSSSSDTSSDTSSDSDSSLSDSDTS